MRVRTTAGWALLAASVCVAAVATAGTRVVTETRSIEEKGVTTSTVVMLVSGQRFRLDPQNRKNTILYRGDQDTLWLLDHRDKTYLKIDRGTAAMVNQVQGELDARMKNLPPEQRAKMEKLLGRQARPNIEVRPTGETDKVSGVPCREIEVLRDGAREALMCEATLADAGLSKETLAPLRELASFAENTVSGLAGGLGQEDVAALLTLDRIDGVPMRVRVYDEGALRSESVVTAIEAKEIPAGDFQPPADYHAKVNINIRGK